ncbi:MAG TPA: aromatic ring-hydroxylating dioxygenase subunit alpha [Pseudonocardia sp.]|jgi:phenylpropionate dioxygenase-like ring-hydroxylating dioxygenase large terminal subunit
MERTFELEIVDELLDVLASKEIVQAAGVHREPVDNYTSEARFAAERDVLFGHTPQAVALSGELPEVGSFKTIDELGVPIVVVRGEDGVVRGFLNVCGHRGARLVEDQRGTARRLACPFHAWSYRPDGSLSGVPGQRAFPGLCRDERALRPVQTREHLGVVWVVVSDAAPMDLAAHLGPFADELARWEVSNWHYLETRVHTVPANWKIVMDTFTEGYHVPVLHKDTIGAQAAGALTAYRAFGDHHRMIFPMKTLAELRDQPRERWRAFAEWRFAITYTLYPNTTFLVAGDHAEMFQTYPGRTVDSSICLHSLFTFNPIGEQEREHYRTLFDFFYNLVATEDFRISAGIERGLRTGAVTHHLYGANEPMTQAMHRAYTRDLATSATGEQR